MTARRRTGIGKATVPRFHATDAANKIYHRIAPRLSPIPQHVRLVFKSNAPRMLIHA